MLQWWGRTPPYGCLTNHSPDHNCDNGQHWKPNKPNDTKSVTDALPDVLAKVIAANNHPTDPKQENNGPDPNLAYLVENAI